MTVSATGSFNGSRGEQASISVKLPVHWVLEVFALEFGFYFKSRGQV
jgi:hypothetical protein